MDTESTSTEVRETSASEFQRLPPELYPNIDHIVTEDDAPVDNIFSEKQQRLLTEPLYSSWAASNDGRPFVAMANVGLFYGIRNDPYVPDTLLSLDVELPESIFPKRHRSYFIWEYGKPPEVVVEIVSNRQGDEDVGKLAGYARLGVKYYAIYDPEKHLSENVLRAFRLVGTTYEPMQEPFWFPGVELGLQLWQGAYEGRTETWLRWFDANQQVIATGAERANHETLRADAERQRAEAESQRAETERQRAETERQRAETERQRADRLADRLRRAGVDPEE